MKSNTTYRIGKYELTHILAQGGMGAVYLGHHRGAGGFNRRVAIKQILPEFVSNLQMRKRFELEAQICSQLNHPNIVQTYDFVQYQGSYYLVMEYINGLSLVTLLREMAAKNFTIPLDLSLFVLREALKGLDFAHNAKHESQESFQIIHRDISPHNIMLSRFGLVKLVDFGLAQSVNSHQFSTVGSIKGKLAYMSPEQAEGKPLNVQTDIYSMGIVAYELITGNPLFTAKTDTELWKTVLHPAIPSLVDSHSEVPLEVRVVIMRALEKDCSKRLQCAEEFLQVIDTSLAKYFPGFGSKNLGSILSLFLVEKPVEKLDSSAHTKSGFSTMYGPKNPTWGKTNSSSFGKFIGIFIMLVLLPGLGFRFVQMKLKRTQSVPIVSSQNSPVTQLQIPHTAPEMTESTVNAAPEASRVPSSAPDQVLLVYSRTSVPGQVEFELTDASGRTVTGDGCSLGPNSDRCFPIKLSGAGPYRMRLRPIQTQGSGSGITYSQKNCVDQLNGKYSPSDGSCEFNLNGGLQIAVQFIPK